MRVLSPTVYFSRSYLEARRRFLDTSAVLGFPVESLANPRPGPEGEPLFTDVVRIGPAQADRILAVTSGVHGVEGFCGSACQTGFLREELWRQLPARTALLLVHAVNPHGFAHLRRVNEDNVDVNRNFIDHDGPPPENRAYEDIHQFLIPSDWGGPAQAAADQAIGALAAARGLRAVQAALQGGQYTHPDGLFYGGRRPVWSNVTWRSVIRRHLMAHRRVAFIDLHSGLGLNGRGEAIFRGRFDGDGYARAKAWYGPDVTCSEDGSSTSSVIVGNMASALDRELPEVELTAITLEFGTVSGPEVLNAMRADQWLHLHGDPASSAGPPIKAAIRDAFYCDTDDWKNRIWERAVDILMRAFAGLAAA